MAKKKQPKPVRVKGFEGWLVRVEGTWRGMKCARWLQFKTRESARRFCRRKAT